ncbi:MAG: 4-fold beta flower protein [Desulfobaccales bacterium]
MEASLFNQNGKAVAYLAADGKTIYQWDGRATAYLVGPRVFGINGRQLGWFENGTFFDIFGLRAGFLKGKSPIPTDIEPAKPGKKAPNIRKPRQGGLAKPTLCYGFSNYFLEEILLEGLES